MYRSKLAMNYRPEIDGLRALAVLPVILFHAGFEWFSGGFIGVDVFFVISGYLITTIIISEMAEGKFSIINFYERRARRILPVLFFVMAVCLPFAWLWLTPNNLKDFGQSLVAVSTFSSNILFWWESGYFDTAAELKPLLHTWSLAVEEQYYILFPIFLMLTWQFGIKWVLILLSILFFISLGIAQWGAYHFPSATFFLLPARGWELLVGVFTAFYLKHNTYLNSHALNQALSLLGFGMIVYSIIAFDQTTPFPSLYALVPTIGTGLLILCAVPKTLIHKLLSLKFIVGIGLISYSAYLWHQPFLAFVRHRLLGDESDFILIVLCIASLVMAWFSWRFVEAPFRNKQTLTRNTVFLFSIVCIVIFSSIGFSMHLKNGYAGRVSFTPELLSSFERPKYADCFGIDFNHTSEVWGCSLGAQKDSFDYVFFGDSHAISFISLLDSLGKEFNKNIYFSGAFGCLPLLNIYLYREYESDNHCYKLNKRVLDFSKANSVKGIILAARWNLYKNGGYKDGDIQYISTAENTEYSVQENIRAFNEAFNFTVDQYTSFGIKINIFTQSPDQKFNPQSIYFQADDKTDIEKASVRRSTIEELNLETERIFLRRSDEVNLINLTDIFCDPIMCPVGTEAISYYYDSKHLSAEGASRLSEEVEKIFKE